MKVHAEPRLAPPVSRRRTPNACCQIISIPNRTTSRRIVKCNEFLVCAAEISVFRNLHFTLNSAVSVTPLNSLSAHFQLFFLAALYNFSQKTAGALQLCVARKTPQMAEHVEYGYSECICLPVSH